MAGKTPNRPDPIPRFPRHAAAYAGKPSVTFWILLCVLLLIVAALLSVAR